MRMCICECFNLIKISLARQTIVMASVGSTQTISFAEIVQGRDASVRVTVDGMIYAVDLVMVMTGLSRDDSGKTLRRLSDEVFPSDKLSERTLPGKIDLD